MLPGGLGGLLGGAAAGGALSGGLGNLLKEFQASGHGGAAQSLILVPEPSAGIPKRGKTQIELTSVKCVANCRVWAAN